MTGAVSLPQGAVIFDCDGVLIDSEMMSARILAEALTEAGHPMTGETVHLRFTGLAKTTMVELMRAEDGIADPLAILDGTRPRILEAFARELTAIEGIEALVRAVGAAGRPMCVASNSEVDRLNNSLGRLPVREPFGAHVYSAQMVARPKPAPDLVALCLEKLGADAADAVMIDDNPPGIAAALGAGVTPIGFVTPGDPRPNRVAILREAGAVAVATSADELAALLGVTVAAVAAPAMRMPAA